jgi:serine/threonine protein kinase
MVALDEVLPSVSHFSDTVTRITIETVEGKPTAAVTEDLDEIIPYLLILPHLSRIPTVQIAKLEKISREAIDVDRVKWRGHAHVFKKTGEILDGTLRELAILDKLSNSPFIIALEAIVVDSDSTIRGILAPSMPAGNLEDVFRRVQEMQALADDPDATAIDWSLKLSLARQISRGVVELHCISAYNRDLKPQNVLLDSTGQVIPIGSCPWAFRLTTGI